ncbi:hypothetical protein N0V85_005303 [Neurospora sp. IMI 360204]|nr:hypothetical protein N0V85_005303 [Neurospora sp. IMI 360204]
MEGATVLDPYIVKAAVPAGAEAEEAVPAGAAVVEAEGIERGKNFNKETKQWKCEGCIAFGSDTCPSELRPEVDEISYDAWDYSEIDDEKEEKMAQILEEKAEAAAKEKACAKEKVAPANASPEE